MFRLGSALLRSTATSATAAPTAAASSLLAARATPLRSFASWPPLRQNEQPPPASPLTDAASPSEPTEQKAAASSPSASTSSSTPPPSDLLSAALSPSSPPSSSSSPPLQDPTLYSSPEAILQRQEDAWAQRRRYSFYPDVVTPSTGRTVVVNNDFERSFQRLKGILSRNNVLNEIRLGERYEKPNQERRRKMSERHRRRFADMIRQKVRLVMELKNRGG